MAGGYDSGPRFLSPVCPENGLLSGIPLQNEKRIKYLSTKTGQKRDKSGTKISSFRTKWD
jgi:hypothetical protein